MYAKTAAHIATGNIKIPVQLDSFDIKTVQYNSALTKLKELQRLIGILEKNLKNKENSKVIPLVNYILILCEGSLFNISQTIRRRFKLLCECKMCKTIDLAPQLTTNLIDFNFTFPDVKDCERIRELVYNTDHQWELLSCLKKVANNTTVLYAKKLRQLQIERNSTLNRPYEVSEFKDKQLTGNAFNIKYVEDILKPVELSLSLDLAVLINDREKDTSEKSFLKLQYQVLTKFCMYLSKKAFPLLRTVYTQLQRYTNEVTKHSKPVGQASSTDALPNWQFTLHRIYAMILKIFSTSCIMTSMLRQIYLTNISYFNDNKTKLMSTNLYEYEELLKKLETFSKIDNSNEMQVTLILEKLTSSGLKYTSTKTSDTITEMYQGNVIECIHYVRSQLHVMLKWQECWKNISTNTQLRTKLDILDEDELQNMVDEKRAVDQLAHIEKSKLKDLEKQAMEDTSGSSSTISSKSSSASVTPLMSALSLNNEEIRPIDLKKKFYKVKPSQASSSSSGSQMNLNDTKSPLALSRRTSMDQGVRVHNATMSSLSKTSSPRHTIEFPSGSPNVGSPKISRRSSIITARVPMSANERDASLSPSRVENPAIIITRKVAARGRPRSASLQSSFVKQNARTNASNSPEPLSISGKRSNSLETTAALNRKIIQNAAVNSMKMEGKTTNAPVVKPPTLYRENRSRSGSGSNLALPGRTRSRSGSGSNAMIENKVRSRSGSGSNNMITGKTRNRSGSGSNIMINGGHPDRFLNTPTKSNLGLPVLSPLSKKRSNLSQEVANSGSMNDQNESDKPQALQFTDTVSDEDVLTNEEDVEITLTKKVRFTGVPPFSEDEEPKPKRQGWYKKPAQLHYPPIPPQVRTFKNRLTQEGVAFRTSLRDNYQDNTSEDFGAENGMRPRRISMFSSEESTNNPFKESMGRKFASKIRNKLRS